MTEFMILKKKKNTLKVPDVSGLQSGGCFMNGNTKASDRCKPLISPQEQEGLMRTLAENISKSLHSCGKENLRTDELNITCTKTMPMGSSVKVIDFKDNQF